MKTLQETCEDIIYNEIELGCIYFNTETQSTIEIIGKHHLNDGHYKIDVPDAIDDYNSFFPKKLQQFIRWRPPNMSS